MTAKVRLGVNVQTLFQLKERRPRKSFGNHANEGRSEKERFFLSTWVVLRRLPGEHYKNGVHLNLRQSQAFHEMTQMGTLGGLRLGTRLVTGRNNNTNENN